MTPTHSHPPIDALEPVLKALEIIKSANSNVSDQQKRETIFAHKKLAIEALAAIQSLPTVEGLDEALEDYECTLGHEGALKWDKIMQAAKHYANLAKENELKPYASKE